jgi:hypothetical protein
MSKALLLGIIMALGHTVAVTAADGTPGSQVIVTEDFEGNAGLEERGWRVDASPSQSEWTISGGDLRIACHRAPYKGGMIARDVPIPDRCEFSFRARLGVGSARDYNHFSLAFRLYGHLFGFKKLGNHMWLGYRPGEKAWVLLATAVPIDEWTHFRVVLDLRRRRAEYYCGKATDPSYVEDNLEIDPDTDTGTLEIFNYGLCSGTVTHRLDDIRLEALPPESTEKAVRTRVLLFNGIAAGRYRVANAIEAALPAHPVSAYTLETHGAAVSPVNKLRLQSVPALSRWQQAALVVLADMPAGPNNVLPPFLLNDLDEAVRNGAVLVVLGGMFSLGKGAYGDTPLEALLPVAVDDPWSVKRFPRPAVLVPGPAAHANRLLPLPDGLAVAWYHDTPPRNAAVEVLLTAGGKPMLVRQRRDRGVVFVFLGTPCGGTNGSTPELFWQSPAWEKLLGRILAYALAQNAPLTQDRQ